MVVERGFEVEKRARDVEVLGKQESLTPTQIFSLAKGAQVLFRMAS